MITIQDCLFAGVQIFIIIITLSWACGNGWTIIKLVKRKYELKRIMWVLKNNQWKLFCEGFAIVGFAALILVVLTFFGMVWLVSPLG